MLAQGFTAEASIGLEEQAKRSLHTCVSHGRKTPGEHLLQLHSSMSGDEGLWE